MDDKQFKAKVQKIKKQKYIQAKQKAKSEFWIKQYDTDEWRELRERILKRDNYRCVSCFKESKNLHVHHLLYQKGRRIWEVPDFYLVTLCPKCHFLRPVSQRTGAEIPGDVGPGRGR